MLTVKKNVILADAVLFITSPECPGLWKESKTDINIIEIPRPNEPIIIGLRRPNWSRKKVGTRLPTICEDQIMQTCNRLNTHKHAVDGSSNQQR